MFMFVVTDMIRFKGTFLAIFYGENHIFALIFEMEWCVLIPFQKQNVKNRFAITLFTILQILLLQRKNGFPTISGLAVKNFPVKNKDHPMTSMQNRVIMGAIVMLCLLSEKGFE